SRVVGGQHLKLRLEEGRFGGLKAIGFRKGELFESGFPGRAIDLTCHLGVPEVQGFESLELRIRALKVLDNVVAPDACARTVEPSASERDELAPSGSGPVAEGAWG